MGAEHTCNSTVRGAASCQGCTDAIEERRAKRESTRLYFSKSNLEQLKPANDGDPRRDRNGLLIPEPAPPKAAKEETGARMSHREIPSATIPERDADGAFPTEYPARWGLRGDVDPFTGYATGPLARYALIASLILVAIIATVVWLAPVTR